MERKQWHIHGKTRNWRLILRAIAVIICIGSIIWFIYEPGFGPVIAFLSGVLALIGSFVNEIVSKPLLLLEPIEKILDYNYNKDTKYPGERWPKKPKWCDFQNHVVLHKIVWVSLITPLIT